MALLPVFGTQPLSAYDLYHSTNDMKQTTAHLGLMPAFRLDVHRLLFGFEGGEIELATETKAPMEAPTEAPTWSPGAPGRHGADRLPEPGGLTPARTCWSWILTPCPRRETTCFRS